MNTHALTLDIGMVHGFTWNKEEQGTDADV
jgi:hypothetical protein